jgi:hypothetical protein
MFFWVKVPCGLVGRRQCIGGACSLHLQDWCDEPELRGIICIGWQEDMFEGEGQRVDTVCCTLPYASLFWCLLGVSLVWLSLCFTHPDWLFPSYFLSCHPVYMVPLSPSSSLKLWRLWQHIFLRCWLLPTSLHSAWTQKNILRIITSVKTLNLSLLFATNPQISSTFCS